MVWQVLQRKYLHIPIAKYTVYELINEDRKNEQKLAEIASKY